MRTFIKVGLVLLAAALGAATSTAADTFVVAFCGVFWGLMAWLVVGLLSLASRGRATSSYESPVEASAIADEPSTEEPAFVHYPGDPFDVEHSPRPGARGLSEETIRWSRG